MESKYLKKWNEYGTDLELISSLGVELPCQRNVAQLRVHLNHHFCMNPACVTDPSWPLEMYLIPQVAAMQLQHAINHK